jgi:hypothetical protein
MAELNFALSEQVAAWQKALLPHILPYSSFHNPDAVKGLLEHHSKYTDNSIAIALAGADPLYKNANELIQKLKSGFCIWTGQQPVLHGGPLMVFHKIWTTIELARSLQEKYNVPVVPIFWMAEDDSDWNECATLQWLNPVGHFKVHGKVKSSDVSVSHNSIEGYDFTCLADFGIPKEILPRQGAMLGELFINAIREVFAGDELLIVSGANAKLKAYSQNLLHKVVVEHPHIKEILQKKAGFLHAQKQPVPVPVGEFPRAFTWNSAGQRKRGWNLPDSQCVWTHDVFSRPPLADSLFPSLGHVLGPGEFAYFAQIDVLYSYLKMPLPMLQPRMHATYIRQGEQAQMHCLHLKEPDWKRPIHWHKEQFWNFFHKELDAFVEGFAPQWQAKSELAMPLQDLIQKNLVALSAGFSKRMKQKVLQGWLKRGGDPAWSAFLDSYNWMGAGRPQDRQLSMPELLQYTTLSELRSKINPLQESHQWIRI